MLRRSVVLFGLLGLFASCSHDPVSSSSGAAGTAGVPSEDAWQEVFSGLPGALMSVWGTGPADVWATGSDAGDGKGGLVLHYDGVRWERRVLGVSADLWWVNGIAGGPVFLGGSKGAIVRYDGGRYELMPTPDPAATVFGIWAASAADVWAVGGDLMGGQRPFVWHFDGNTWKPVPVPDASPRSAYFKVWGAAADDVWVVGSGGALLHYDGVKWTFVDAGTEEPLFTVHAVAGAAGRAMAVGGYDLGVALGRDGTPSWRRADLPEGTRQLFGVWLTEGSGFAVGVDAAVLRVSASGCETVPTGLATRKALHSVWGDDSGGVWAVGGDVLVPPLRDGVLVHFGQPTSTTLVETGVPLVAGDGGLERDAVIRDASGADVASTALDGAYALDAAHDVDASFDAPSPEPEAGPPRIAGEILCGATTCTPGTQTCCVDGAGQAPSQCVDNGTLCPSGFYPMTCDQRADCPDPTDVCCLQVFLQGGGVASIACATSCFGHSLCASSDECGGASCSPISFLPEYRQCP
jgi:hypothetical protein